MAVVFLNKDLEHRFPDELAAFFASIGQHRITRITDRIVAVQFHKNGFDPNEPALARLMVGQNKIDLRIRKYKAPRRSS